MEAGAAQLLDWMARRGLSQQETARLWGWDVTFVSKLVRGHRLPGLANALKIERETGIPVEAWMVNPLADDETLIVSPGRKSNQTK